LVALSTQPPECAGAGEDDDRKRFGREALTLPRQLFCLWRRFRGDPPVRGAPLTREQLIAKVLPIEQRFCAVAERHVNAAAVEVSNLARALFVHHPHFFTFVHEEGVDPTNNVAERDLRTAVQWRKIMFGNRSAEGELAVARLLTVARTCQLQHLNVLAYLTRGDLVVPSSASCCFTAQTAYPLNCYYESLVSGDPGRPLAHRVLF
jgi:hypothetical protein